MTGWGGRRSGAGAKRLLSDWEVEEMRSLRRRGARVALRRVRADRREVSEGVRKEGDGMTGIERLRELADKYAGLGKDHTTIDVVPSGMAMLFSSIANQIEREHAEDCYGMVIDHGTVSRVASDMERHVLGHEGMEDSPVARWARELREALGGGERDHAEDVSMSAYDLLPQDEREAIAWVREHGGVDAVKANWSGRVPLSSVKRMVELHKKKRERLKAHALWLERKCGERRERINELEHERDELRPRLMPEGMTWPCWDDGKPVTYDDSTEDAIGVFLALDGSCWAPMDAVPDGWLERGESLDRPAKVLDSDGVEIEVGDDLYSVEGGLKLHVGVIDTRNGKIATAEMYAIDKWADPAMYTHRAPVLAADGKPLREGETVYHVADGRACVVREVRENGAVVEPVDGRPCGRCRADYLTHERPDTRAQVIDGMDKETVEKIDKLVRDGRWLDD